MPADHTSKKASYTLSGAFHRSSAPGAEAILTFAPLPIEGPKDHQVSCVRHGPLVQIVFLHLQPVPLSRLICTLREEQRETSN